MVDSLRTLLLPVVLALAALSSGARAAPPIAATRGKGMRPVAPAPRGATLRRGARLVARARSIVGRLGFDPAAHLTAWGKPIEFGLELESLNRLALRHLYRETAIPHPLLPDIVKPDLKWLRRPGAPGWLGRELLIETGAREVTTAPFPTFAALEGASRFLDERVGGWFHLHASFTPPRDRGLRRAIGAHIAAVDLALYLQNVEVTPANAIKRYVKPYDRSAAVLALAEDKYHSIGIRTAKYKHPGSDAIDPDRVGIEVRGALDTEQGRIIAASFVRRLTTGDFDRARPVLVADALPLVTGRLSKAVVDNLRDNGMAVPLYPWERMTWLPAAVRARAVAARTEYLAELARLPGLERYTYHEREKWIPTARAIGRFAQRARLSRYLFTELGLADAILPARG